jgi:Fe-S-cluster containining protein
MPERFECDQCGACCKGTLFVEADDLDFEREPAIKDCDPFYRDKSVTVTRELLSDGMRVIMLAGGTDRPCSLLDCENRCTIYPTRPNSCVGMQAGDEQCQMARQSLGIPPLESVKDV